MKIQTLKERLLALHLRGMEGILEETLKKATVDNLSPVDVLLLLAEQELAERKQKIIKYRVCQAAFPTIKTIDAFNFNFPKSINKANVLALFDLQFVHQKQNVILMGPPGTGKTHIALSLGYQACQAGIKTLFTTAMNLINHLSASLADNSFLKTMKLYKTPQLLRRLGVPPSFATRLNKFNQHSLGSSWRKNLAAHSMHQYIQHTTSTRPPA